MGTGGQAAWGTRQRQRLKEHIVNIRRARRLEQLPPYLFVEIDRAKEAALAAGRDVIDFGVGDPDRPTLSFVVEKMAEAIRNPRNHCYSLGRGKPPFRRAVADFYRRRYGVALDADREVMGLIGSKEGIGHLPIAVVNPGETVLVPQPGYPVYIAGAVFAGAKYHLMPLRAERGFLPDLTEIPADVYRAATLMWLNYPNNPTAACAPLSFYREVVAFAREHDIIVAQDAAYHDLYFEAPPAALLQVPGAKEVAIELHSLSKTFNMTGWRAGFAVGNADIVSALAATKANLDSGLFAAVEEAAATALANIDHPEVHAMREVYRRRRDVLAEGLARLGWEVNRPQATFYMWVRCPAGVDSMTAARRLLAEADVVVIPGAGFGAAGEGFIRFALTREEDRIREAVGRIGKLRW